MNFKLRFLCLWQPSRAAATVPKATLSEPLRRRATATFQGDHESALSIARATDIVRGPDGSGPSRKDADEFEDAYSLHPIAPESI